MSNGNFVFSELACFTKTEILWPFALFTEMSSVSVGGQASPANILCTTASRSQLEGWLNVCRKKYSTNGTSYARSAKVTSSLFIELLFSHELDERESRESEGEGKWGKRNKRRSTWIPLFLHNQKRKIFIGLKAVSMSLTCRPPINCVPWGMHRLSSLDGAAHSLSRFVLSSARLPISDHVIFSPWFVSRFSYYFSFLFWKLFSSNSSELLLLTN